MIYSVSNKCSMFMGSPLCERMIIYDMFDIQRFLLVETYCILDLNPFLSIAEGIYTLFLAKYFI